MSEKNYTKFFDLNKFLRFINLKKQYFKQLKNKETFLSQMKEKNYKHLNVSLANDHKQPSHFVDNLITYVIDLKFSRSNTLLHVMDFSGKLKFFYSAGSVKYSGKNKKSRYMIFRDLYRILVSKLAFLKGKPVALHLTNVGINKTWIVKKLKKRFFIKCVKTFNLHPHNGCRKRKMRRKKFKKKK